jgi:tetratricopeptide (TPR) repeat protein
MGTPPIVTSTGAVGTPAGAAVPQQAATDPTKTFVAKQIDPSHAGGAALNDGLALDRAGKPREAMVKYDQAADEVYRKAFGELAKPFQHQPRPPAAGADESAWVNYDRESRLHNDELLDAFKHAPAKVKSSAAFQELSFYVETAINRKGVAYNHMGPAHQPEALAAFKSILREDKHFGPALYNEAVSLLKVGLPKDALKELSRALSPSSSPAVSKNNAKGDKDWQLLPANLRAEFDRLTR